MSGITPVAFFGIANWLQHIRAGTVVALAVEGPTRSPLLPDVPTLAELGYRGSLTYAYFGLVAPSGTPKPIIQKLHDEIARIGSDPDFRQRHMIDVGIVPIFDTPEAFGRFLAEDRAAAARVVQKAGIKPQ
jgi:tripartite-type tricarboxylate transporter receptor subunit TctC